MDPIERGAGETALHDLMQRVALVRLRRFARIAEVAEQSDSRIWRELARSSARGAYRDALLLGLGRQADERAA